MPLVWEKSLPLVRSIWIFSLFLFFFVEYRAIDKAAQESARNEAELLQVEHESFQKILDQGQRNFESGMSQERADFLRMMNNFSSSQIQEREQFSGVLEEERRLFARQEQLAQALNGRLYPASDPTPANICREIPQGAVILFLGDNAFVIWKFPHIVLHSRSLGPLVTLDRAPDGSITVLADVRSRDGRIIARMDQSGFVVNRNNLLEIQETRSALSVVDEYGTEVLDARYLNPQAFKLSGVLHYQSRDIPLQSEFMSRSCVAGGEISLSIP
jgi:hypothetical protein